MNLRKLRGKSLAELRARGRQKWTALAERIGLANVLPSDADFFATFDKNDFDEQEITARVLHENFRQRAPNRFFPAFQDPAQTAKFFRDRFGAAAVVQIVERATRAVSGNFDLLGFKNLDFGVPVDWHLEPVAGKRAPLKHWQLFDELDADETGDKKIVWELNRGQHFFDLGAAYWLTGDERFAAAFAMHLCGWIEQNPQKLGVNWISSLEVGFRAIPWLWGLHFFKDSPNLSPSVFAHAIKHLRLHGQHIEQYLSTFYSPNTHLTGEALALYYLGALIPELDSARRWRETGARILLDELDRQILSDGVYFEQSTWYARYTADFYTHFLILSSVNQEKFRTRDHEKLETKLQLALDFLMHAQRPDGTAPLVGDDDGGRMLPFGAQTAANDFRATLSTGAVLFNRGDYKFAAGASACAETLWLLGAAKLGDYDCLEAHPPIEKSKHFRAGGYFAARSDWTADADFIFFDGGRHSFLNGGHAHADALAFEFAARGAPALVDPGTYTYHESIETRNHFRRTAAHNAAIIDGEPAAVPAGKFAWRTAADAEFTTVVQNRRFDFVAAAHNGFSGAATNETLRHSRSILFLRGDYTIICDRFDARDEHDYELNFHFAPGFAATQNNDGELLCARANPNAEFKICAFGAGGAWRTGEDWVSTCYGSREPAAVAAFVNQGAGAQQFFTFLLSSNNAANRSRIVEIKVVGGRGFKVESADFQDFLLCRDKTADDGTLVDETFRSDFGFAWARVHRATAVLTELILLDGENFAAAGKSVVAATKNLRYARAWRTGKGEPRFETDESEFCRFAAQNFDSKIAI